MGHVFIGRGQYTVANLRTRWLHGRIFSPNLVRAAYTTVTRWVRAGKFLLHDRYTLENFAPKVGTRPSKITTRPLHPRKFLSRIYTAGNRRLHHVTEGGSQDL